MLFGLASSGIAGLFGGALGAILFLTPSGSLGSFAWALHPDLMVFSFLTLFVLTVATSLMPKLNRAPPRPKLGLFSTLALAAAGILWIVFDTRPLLGDFALLSSSLGFAAFTLCAVRRPKNALGYGDVYFGAGAVTLFAVALIKTAVDMQKPYFEWQDYAYTWLAVVGFPTSMIFGVWQHTSHFRGVIPRNAPSVVTALLWCVTLAIYTLSAVAGGATLLAKTGAVIETVTVAAFLLSQSAFTPARPAVRFAFEPNRGRYVWFDRSMRIASFWLAVGTALQLAFALYPGGFRMGYEELLDAWLHTVTLGFYLIVISSYAPVMLPVLLNGRPSAIRLTLVPQLLVSVGVVWRLLADLLVTLAGSGSMVFLAYSPTPVIIAIFILLANIHSVSKGQREDSNPAKPVMQSERVGQ